MTLLLSSFSYELPSENIALFPLSDRGASRLLVYEKGTVKHQKFNELPCFLPKGSTLLFNNSKVVPARLFFKKETGSQIELFLLEPFGMDYTHVFNETEKVVFKVLVGNKKRWREGQVLNQSLEGLNLQVSWVDREQNTVLLSWDNQMPFADVLASMGKLPLPPYLNREAQTDDYHTYQTVFAEVPGAVAAPTAALHFTPNMLSQLDESGVQEHKMTLHVSAGTFLPVTVENVLEHPMHNEVFYFGASDVETLFTSSFLTCVGTTSLRMAESLFWMGYAICAGDAQGIEFDLDQNYAYQKDPLKFTKQEIKEALLGALLPYGDAKVKANTRILIYPGYTTRMAQAIITNFHQPESTLIMLIAALIGEDWKKVYEEALNEKYRFLSYGDSSLLIL
jgi:S-adenosylmethionine:tRNA ribosyltransferase-isomerase